MHTSLIDINSAVVIGKEPIVAGDPACLTVGIVDEGIGDFDTGPAICLPPALAMQNSRSQIGGEAWLHAAAIQKGMNDMLVFEGGSHFGFSSVCDANAVSRQAGNEGGHP